MKSGDDVQADHVNFDENETLRIQELLNSINLDDPEVKDQESHVEKILENLIVPVIESIKNNGNPDATDKNGNTVLHYMARIYSRYYSDEELRQEFDSLINLFAISNIHSKNNDGLTPLAYMMSDNQFNAYTAYAFVKLGADPATRSADGKTLLSHIEESSYPYKDYIIGKLINDHYLNPLIDEGIDKSFYLPASIRKKIRIDRNLGSGSSGTVYSGKYIEGTSVAIKHCFLKKNDLGFGKQIRHVRNEIKTLSALSNKDIANLVKFTGFSVDEREEDAAFWIVMEYAERGSLRNVFATYPVQSWKIRIEMMHGLSEAVQWLHHYQYVHSDIKPANVLVKQDWQIKLTDFDLSFKYIQLSDVINIKNRGAGSSGYMPPEVYDLGCSFAGDVFSMGVTFRDIAEFKDVNSALPQGLSRNEKKTWYKSGARPPIVNDCPQGVAELINLSWMQKPDDRPPAKEICDGLKQQLALVI